MTGLRRILTVLCVMASITAWAQETKTSKNPLAMIEIGSEPAVVIGGIKISIGQAIVQAIEKNHDILSGAYDVAMTDSPYEQFQKKYSIFLNGDIGMKYSENPGSTAMFYGKDRKTIDGSISLFKIFSSGTQVAAGLKHEFAKSTYDIIELSLHSHYDQDGILHMDTAPTPIDVPLSFGYPETHMPVFFVSVQQELLKNAFGYEDRRLLKIMENASKMQKEAILEGLSMVVLGVIAEYWTVVVDRLNLANSELQLEETKNVRNITARNVRLGLADSFNLNYYNALVAGAEAAVAMAEQKYKNSLRSFLTTVNLDENIDLSGSAVFNGTLPGLSVEEALKNAYKRRADYNNALLAVENARMDLEIKSNGAMPSVVAQLNFTSMSQDPSLGTAYSDTASAEYPSIEARVKLSYPLDDKEQIINERNAKYKLKQARIKLEQTKRRVKDDVIGKVEQIETSFMLYQKASEARKQAEIFYWKMIESMRRGRLTAAVVKNGIDAIVQGRQKELEALVYFNISLLQLDVAQNRLFEKYNIDVDKYIPKDK